MRIELMVNGARHAVDDVREGESLLYALRERMGLPGSKNACEQGECGSCTVYLDGLAVCSCLVAAGQAHGREVTTVEGLADGAELCAPPPLELLLVNGQRVVERDRVLTVDEAELARECAAVHRTLVEKS
jgi:xanthine dehydrogenase iron-sulfur cluster and FAD-binding subunit A